MKSFRPKLVSAFIANCPDVVNDAHKPLRRGFVPPRVAIAMAGSLRHIEMRKEAGGSYQSADGANANALRTPVHGSRRVKRVPSER